MTQENVEEVEQAIAAFNERDLDSYLCCCTEGVHLSVRTLGTTTVYDGPDGISRFFDDLSDTTPDFTLAVERMEAVGADRVLSFMRVTMTGRASGVPIEARTGSVYDLAEGKIKRDRKCGTRARALEAAGLSE